MKCLVTGATGFVGGHLCERLVAEGHEVFAMARTSSKRDLLEGIGARIVNGTLDSINVFAHYAAEIDVVFHLAAVTKPVNERDFFAVNARGTERMIRGLNRGDFRGRVVYLSSQAAGGPARNRQRPRKESDKDHPVSIYGRSKRAGEKCVREKLPQGCTWTILRPGAIYGPREHEILEVLRMIERRGIAVGFGESLYVQMTHVEDVVEGLLRAAFNPQASGKTYYLCNRPAWTFEEIVHMAAEALGKDVRIIRLPLFSGRLIGSTLDIVSRLAGRSVAPFGRDKMREMEARYWIADPSLLESELNWSSKYDFPQGLQSTVRWYRDNDCL
jgi:nucleoside-diphosphate-sugar epimerase